MCQDAGKMEARSSWDRDEAKMAPKRTPSELERPRNREATLRADVVGVARGRVNPHPGIRDCIFTILSISNIFGLISVSILLLQIKDVYTP